MENETSHPKHQEPTDHENLLNATIKDVLPYAKNSAVTESFLKQVFDLLIEYLLKVFDRNEKVIDFQPPTIFLQDIDGYSVNLDGKPVKLGELIQDCKKTLKYGVKTGHPRHFNTLSSGMDVISLAGEWLTATANANLINYEFAPVFVMMEEVVLKRMREIIGWRSGGDGTFAPGGSISNMYAMMLARQKVAGNVKMKGLVSCGQTLVSFQSKHAHYSASKCAAVLGIGLDNAVAVDVDERGRMIVEDLERKIKEAREEGKVPFMVTATAGTTVVGAFDPIDEIGDVCSKHGIWFHVDAAWGGGALMSNKHRHLLKGIEKADSVTWNPHKIMGILLQCSCFLTKHEGVLYECNRMSAGYVFQPDKCYDSLYDVGDKTIQCGRHVDVFKLWLSWKARGDAGFTEHVDKCIALAQYMYKKLQETKGFKIVYEEPQFTNVCFWYIPSWLEKLAHDKEKQNHLLGKLAPAIKEEMVRRGTLMMTYVPLDRNVNFFRMVISNPAAERADIDFAIELIGSIGDQIELSALSNGF